MKTHLKKLPGVMLVEVDRFTDERGFFEESWREEWFGIKFVQDNYAKSKAGVLRGMHYQRFPGQVKYVRCLSGRIYDVALDLDTGMWVGEELYSGRGLLIPGNYAHGYYCIEDSEVSYKVSTYYDPEEERGVRWDKYNIDWPKGDKIINERDLNWNQ